MKSLLFSALMPLILCSCIGGRKTPSDTLVVALASAPSTLDPRFATDANGMRIGGLIFNSLVRAGPEFKPIGDAAQTWSYQNKKFVFALRPELRFHNGRPLEPEDIEFSFSQFMDSKSPFSSTLALIKKVKAERKKDGNIQVEIEVKNYSDKFLLSDLSAVRLLPKKETEAAGVNFSRILIGTGGYRFLKRDLASIRLEGVSSKIKFLTFKIVKDDLTRFQKMLKGEVDIVQADLPPEKITEFENHPERFQVLRYPGLAMSYILLNFKDPLLRQKNVRKALDASLERQEIIAYKMRNLATEATSLLTPQNPYFNSQLTNPPQNLSEARKLIEDLGLKGSKLTLKTSNSPSAIDNGRVIARQISQSGLNIELQSYEWATFYDDVKKGNFQLATMKWVGTLDPDIYRMAFHSKEIPPGRNRGSYLNPGLDVLLEKSASTEDMEQRKKIILQVQKIVHDDLAIIPLWYDLQVAVAKKSIVDYHPDQSGEFLPFLNVRKMEHAP